MTKFKETIALLQEKYEQYKKDSYKREIKSVINKTKKFLPPSIDKQELYERLLIEHDRSDNSFINEKYKLINRLREIQNYQSRLKDITSTPLKYNTFEEIDAKSQLIEEMYFKKSLIDCFEYDNQKSLLGENAKKINEIMDIKSEIAWRIGLIESELKYGKLLDDLANTSNDLDKFTFYNDLINQIRQDKINKTKISKEPLEITGIPKSEDNNEIPFIRTDKKVEENILDRAIEYANEFTKLINSESGIIIGSCGKNGTRILRSSSARYLSEYTYTFLSRSYFSINGEKIDSFIDIGLITIEQEELASMLKKELDDLPWIDRILDRYELDQVEIERRENAKKQANRNYLKEAVYHELGHLVENSIQDEDPIRYRSGQSYILSRSSGKDPNDALEFTYKTDFHNTYTGTIRSQSSTELISTGTEMLANPITLSEYLNIDREHILFTLWALDFKE